MFQGGMYPRSICEYFIRYVDYLAIMKTTFLERILVVSRCERKIIAITCDKHNPINLPSTKYNNACLMNKILLIKFLYVKPDTKSAMRWGVFVHVGPAPYIGHVSHNQSRRGQTTG